MRLLHTSTLKLEEFIGSNIPPYAILSHTWGDDEVSFQDMQGSGAMEKVGYEKIRRCCEKAATGGFEYAWVDTCCIDKSSSSELSEAINSMYRWYQDAEVCYVSLSDVPHDYESLDLFKRSRWFTRRWTLQELIAPSMVIFFDSDWEEIGTKSSLQISLIEVTGIPANILQGDHLDTASIAQRMSWASKRDTTRIEDIAYCLMGLFGVHMPMLYGEGRAAFIRLQEEIIKASDDHSIFAWKLSFGRETHGLLATLPSMFMGSSNIVQLPKHDETPFSTTNKGMHIHLRLTRLGESGIYKALLDCQEFGVRDSQLSIDLQRTSNLRQFVRVNLHQLQSRSAEEIRTLYCLRTESVYVTQGEIPSIPSPDNGCIVKLRRLADRGITLREFHPHPLTLAPSVFFPRASYPAADGIAVPLPYEGTIVSLTFRVGTRRRSALLILLGLKSNMAMVCVMAEPYHSVEETQNRLLLTNQMEFAIKSPSQFISQDRVVWEHPNKDWRINIDTNRQVINGRRTLVVEMR